MNSIERATLQDLIDGKADVGPDGGIWYPSGPSDVPVSRIFAALVEKVRESERLLAASCEETRANFSELYQVVTEVRTLSKIVDWLVRKLREFCPQESLANIKETARRAVEEKEVLV